jgi:hypothetical protein
LITTGERKIGAATSTPSTAETSSARSAEKPPSLRAATSRSELPARARAVFAVDPRIEAAKPLALTISAAATAIVDTVRSKRIR